jgi:5-methylthioribose kinase
MNKSVGIDLEFLRQLRDDGIILSDAPSFQVLTGGVSSEIFRVEDSGRLMVIKRALEKLKVAADWYADVSRNTYEVGYLEYVAQFLPKSVPKILGRGSGYFVMEYLDGSFENWKELLKAGKCEVLHAEQAGNFLGQIHQYSCNEPGAADRFDAVKNFTQLRVAPYLYHISEKHSYVADFIHEETRRLLNTRECLIHGDFSPKNILISPKRMVVVDCEVAFYGDPGFDIAFLLSHLLLKGLLHAPVDVALEKMSQVFLESYKKQRSAMVDIKEIDDRVARLLVMLLLARVDGKSPVEYLGKDKRAFVRDFTLRKLKGGNCNLPTLIKKWFEALTRMK